MTDRYHWTDNCCESGVAQCNTDILNENLMHLKYDVFEKLQDEGLSITDVLNALYPIGAIYIGTMNTCPLSAMGFGTWVLKSRGRVLQGATASQTTGTTINAGLPNITGTFRSGSASSGVSRFGADGIYTNGAFTQSGKNTSCRVLRATDGSDNTGYSLGFDASNSNEIYGNSTTVQPPAYLVNIWERTA